MCISISVSADLYICSLYLYNCVSGRHQIFIDVPGEAAKQSLHIQYSVVTRGKCSKLPIRHSNKPKPNEQPAKQWPSPHCHPPLPSRPLLSIGQEPRAKSVPAFETSCLKAGGSFRRAIIPANTIKSKYWNPTNQMESRSEFEFIKGVGYGRKCHSRNLGHSFQ